MDCAGEGQSRRELSGVVELSTSESEGHAVAYGNAARSRASVRETKNYRGSLMIKCRYSKPLPTATSAPMAKIIEAPLPASGADAGSNNGQFSGRP